MFTSYEYDVKSEFKDVYRWWKKKDHITVYGAEKSWKLEVRKRSYSNRTTIHDGWVQIRGDLQLKANDVCKFEVVDGDMRMFRVVVYRS